MTNAFAKLFAVTVLAAMLAPAASHAVDRPRLTLLSLIRRWSSINCRIKSSGVR
jgi:hypothetical protein